MASCNAQATISPATWHRKGDVWHLIAAEKSYARIDRDGRRLLCYVLDDGENDHFIGQCRSLASGKAHLVRRYAFPSSVNRIAEKEASL
jgi:hypothetical protein